MKRAERKELTKTSKIIRLLLSAALVLAAVLILRNDRVEAILDNVVLLEKRNPGYWNYLSSGSEIRTADGFDEVPAAEVLNGNELKELYSGQYNGITQSVQDSVISFSGTASQDCYPEIGNISGLTAGTYFVSVIPLDGGRSAEDGCTNSIKFYIQTVNDYGWRGTSIRTLADANFGSCVYFDPPDYDSASFLAYIPAGTSVDDSYRPVVFKISDENIVEKDGIITYSGVNKNSITEDDRKIFDHRNEDDDYIISYTDGTVEGNDGTADIDNIGRIQQ